jgi:putative peptidoglycan lipid II flippase
MVLGLSLGAIAGFNILITFAYQWYVLTTIGPGPATDALFAGMVVPQLVLVIVSGSLNYVLVPLLAVEEGEARTRLAWTYVQGIAAACLVLVLLLMVGAPHWVPLAFPGFSPDAARLAVQLTRIQLFGITFTAVTGVEWALHHARQQFVRAEGSAVVGSVAGLAFIWYALPRVGISAAAWGTLVRSGLQMLILLPGLGPYRAPQWKHPGLGIGLRRTGPLTAGQVYYKSDALLDRFFASLAPPGVLSLYHVSQQLYASASMVLNRAIVAPVVPRLSQLASLNEWPNFTAQIRRRLLAVVVVGLVGTAGLVFVGHPLLALIFHRGEFTQARIDHLWWLLILLSGVWLGGTTGQILSSSFYAQGDTRTPTMVGIIGFTVAIVLKLYAFRRYGIDGLAVAASAYYLLNAAALLVCLRQRTRRVRGVPRPVPELARL